MLLNSITGYTFVGHLQLTVCTVIQKCNIKHLSIYPFDMSAILDSGRSHVLRIVYLKLTTNNV